MAESSTHRFSWKHLLLLHTVLEEHKLALIKKGGAEEQLTLIEDFQRAYDRFAGQPVEEVIYRFDLRDGEIVP